MSTYADKLRDGRWQRKRLDVFQRDGFRCRICGKQDNIQLHHNWYINDLEPWDYEEEQLITLCGSHHAWVTSVHRQLKMRLSRMTPEQQNALLLKLEAMTSETCKSVRLTSSGEDTFRLPRLRQVVAYLSDRDDAALLTLVALHDHKGTLEATWAPFTPDESFLSLEAAWRAAGECDVKHFEMEGVQ
jgi:hypothetical protein